MDTIGSMLSIPVELSECPDSLLPLLFMCQKLDQKLPGINGIVAQYWSIMPGGIHQVLHEPITGVDSFDVFGIEECSSADWNAQSGVNLPIILMECNGM